MNLVATTRGRIAVAFVATVCVGGSAFAIASRGNSSRSGAPTTGRAAVTTAATRPASTTVPRRVARKPKPLVVPAPLTKAGLSLRAGPVAVPLELRIPSIGVNAPMLGVGITASNVMDAPMGPRGDPVWQQAFWYRGSAVPGVNSTALIAGHIDSVSGPAVFAHIDRLKTGDLIVVHDTRTNLDVRFAVTSATSYSLAETRTPDVLRRMYGAGPVAGTWPQPSADGRAHLTLVTCSGTFDYGLRTHDHRLVVYAVRIP